MGQNNLVVPWLLSDLPLFSFLQEVILITTRQPNRTSLSSDDHSCFVLVISAIFGVAEENYEKP
jgi:hypothetical protein